MNRKFSLAVAVVLAAGFLGACGSTPKTGDAEERQLLTTRSTSALADFKTTDPSLQRLLDRAYAYVIFPKVVTGAVGVGGAHGDGEVYEKGQLIGYADVSQGSIGLQIGGQTYSELIVFESAGPLADFQKGTLEFDARATAVAASAGAGDAATYNKGVVIFTRQESGLMAQAAIGGQKFRYTPVQ